MREGEPQIETGILERETPLTTEEIATRRSEMIPHEGKRRDYQFEDISVSILQKGMSQEVFDKNKEQLLAMNEGKESGEIFAYEKLLVNALVEQGRIAKMFGVDRGDLWTNVVADYNHKGKAMMAYMGNEIFMLSLDEHVNTLKKEGATDEQITTEIAGQMFHESMHAAEPTIHDELLHKKGPLGEVTPITAQLAYYFAKGYKGPKGYDNYSCSLGQEEIKKGKDSTVNHEIAASVSAEILLEQLAATYPEIAKSVETKTSLDTCEEIVAKIPEEGRDSLMPCLKKAILKSTDRDKFKEILEILKERNNKK